MLEVLALEHDRRTEGGREPDRGHDRRRQQVRPSPFLGGAHRGGDVEGGLMACARSQSRAPDASRRLASRAPDRGDRYWPHGLLGGPGTGGDTRERTAPPIDPGAPSGRRAQTAGPRDSGVTAPRDDGARCVAHAPGGVAQGCRRLCRFGRGTPARGIPACVGRGHRQAQRRRPCRAAPVDRRTHGRGARHREGRHRDRASSGSPRVLV